VLLVLGVAGAGRSAAATDCSPASGLSPCFEADAARTPTGHARFAFFPRPLSVPRGQAAVTLGQSYTLRPLTLRATSPDPEGRKIPVVEHELGFTLGLGVGLGHALELSAALPMTLLRDGIGLSGVTSQDATELASTAVYDPTFGLAFTPLTSSPNQLLGVKARLDVSLPMGEEDVLAGYAGPGLLPALDLELLLGRVSVGAEIGARLGESVDFATTRQGSWLTASLGLAFDVLDRERLGVALEGTLRQNLESVDVAPGTAKTSGPAAEWLGSVRIAEGPYSALVGAGTGLPLARERRGSEGEEAVLAPTAPAFRALVRLSYTPR
jgi:hypothetical protein